MSTQKSKYETIEISSFKDYIDFIADMGDTVIQDLWLFRGQLTDKPLIPKLGRLDISNIKEFELKVFNDFRKRYQAYSTKKFDTDLDLLALGQHFGLATRLLDWTENSLVALWFATERDIDERYSVVWLFMPDEVDIISEKEIDPFSINATKIFCPNHISERITAQSGWFTCHKLMDTNRFLHLETMKKYYNKLAKIKIPRKLFPEIRVKLNSMGVNSSSVYPDLAGLSRQIMWKSLKEERF